jgi:ATPase subunit of ABC transporter with duplicated ATPase domains
MDECFVNLDKNNLTMVEQILKKDNGQWLIVSHDINFAEALKV